MNTRFSFSPPEYENILPNHFYPRKQAPNRLPVASGILNVDRSKIMIFTKQPQDARQSSTLDNSTHNKTCLDVALHALCTLVVVVAKKVSRSARVIEAYNAFGNV